jgi:hypothetical protein
MSDKLIKRTGSSKYATLILLPTTLYKISYIKHIKERQMHLCIPIIYLNKQEHDDNAC